MNIGYRRETTATRLRRSVRRATANHRPALSALQVAMPTRPTVVEFRCERLIQPMASDCAVRALKDTEPPTPLRRIWTPRLSIGVFASRGESVRIPRLDQSSVLAVWWVLGQPVDTASENSHECGVPSMHWPAPATSERPQIVQVRMPTM